MPIQAVDLLPAEGTSKVTGISLVTALQFCIRGLTQRAASRVACSDPKLSCNFAIILPIDGPQLDICSMTEGVGLFLGFGFRLRELYCCGKVTGLWQASAFFLWGALAVSVSLGVPLSMQRNRKSRVRLQAVSSGCSSHSLPAFGSPFLLFSFCFETDSQIIV